MKIKIDSENESQLKRIRKPPLSLSQEESLAKEVKKCPFQFDKSQKTYNEKDISQTFFSSKTFVQNPKSLFTFWLLFSKFQKQK